MVQWSVSDWLVQHVDVQKKIVNLTPGFLFHECLQMRIVGGRCYSFTKSSLPAACQQCVLKEKHSFRDVRSMYSACRPLLTDHDRACAYLHSCAVLSSPVLWKGVWEGTAAFTKGRYLLLPTQSCKCDLRSQPRENVAPRVIWTWLRTPVSTCMCVRDCVCSCIYRCLCGCVVSMPSDKNVCIKVIE